MSRAIFLSAVFLITALTFNTAFAQTNAREGDREAEALYSKAEALYGEGKRDAALEQYRKLQSLNSPLASSLFRVVYGDKLLNARR